MGSTCLELGSECGVSLISTDHFEPHLLQSLFSLTLRAYMRKQGFYTTTRCIQKIMFTFLPPAHVSNSNVTSVHLQSLVLPSCATQEMIHYFRNHTKNLFFFAIYTHCFSLEAHLITRVRVRAQNPVRTPP